jgi:hypothetical protein
MPDYQNGKIYKITSGELTYIGSTCEPTLARRLAGHIKDYKRCKKNNKKFVSSFTIIETGQYEITLIELFPCGSKDELTARERFHIETNVCVNRSIPTRTKVEYNEANKEAIQTQHKEYYEANKETLLQKNKATYQANKVKRLQQMKANREKKKALTLQQDTGVTSG